MSKQNLIRRHAASKIRDFSDRLLAIASPAVFAFLALFWTVPAMVLGKGARAGGIAFVSSIGGMGSAFSPVFMGWTQTLTGSLFGAVAVLALVFLASMAALYFCVPAVAASRGAKTAPVL